ncbi:hypothetical protein V6N13_079477 [Hibiscus sabdariffa]|uniref:FLZ-type domain-containing protein n=1 Tax=Hibiscus sabdariffa TaxID=183260 RepID=A0ABR2RRJ2_9ROSI
MSPPTSKKKPSKVWSGKGHRHGCGCQRKVVGIDKSRAVTSKQALMADHSSESSPVHEYTRPTPFLFGSPRFKAFITTKCLAESPTSILDNKPLFPFSNHSCFHPNQPKSPKRFISPETSEPKAIGLAIVDTLDDKPIENNGSLQTSNNKVLFENRLKVSMELSEDYTCVKSHGPNPKTTHIYDDCIVKSCCSTLDEPKCAPKSDYFLSFCHTCKRNLEQKIDIYIYRGEKAFCSQECRYQEMILHGEEN